MKDKITLTNFFAFHPLSIQAFCFKLFLIALCLSNRLPALPNLKLINAL
jgi:hypothetical protein